MKLKDRFGKWLVKSPRLMSLLHFIGMTHLSNREFATYFYYIYWGVNPEALHNLTCNCCSGPPTGKRHGCLCEVHNKYVCRDQYNFIGELYRLSKNYDLSIPKEDILNLFRKHPTMGTYIDNPYRDTEIYD